jgi:TetR/AcrR family transcriptional regulator, regulator of autoinduction and epiphytic fitness
VVAAIPFPSRKPTFREQQFVAREQAILDATNRLLSQKGYELMVMDDIAAEVGIAKGSLYKHFDSKESLAGAVLIQLLRRTHDALRNLPAALNAMQKLQEILRWVWIERLAGAVPHLPSTSQSLSASLVSNTEYMDQLMQFSDSVGELISQAKEDGLLRTDLPDEFILYSLYARSCDPTLDYLKAGGAFSDQQLIDLMLSASFAGLAIIR